MAMTNREHQKEHRDRMYAAGYKQMRIWVPRESEGKTAKLERKIFTRWLEALTAGYSAAKLSRFLSSVLKIVKERIKEDEQK